MVTCSAGGRANAVTPTADTPASAPPALSCPAPLSDGTRGHALSQRSVWPSSALQNFLLFIHIFKWEGFT